MPLCQFEGEFVVVMIVLAFLNGERGPFYNGHLAIHQRRLQRKPASLLYSRQVQETDLLIANLNRKETIKLLLNILTRTKTAQFLPKMLLFSGKTCGIFTIPTTQISTQNFRKPVLHMYTCRFIAESGAWQATALADRSRLNIAEYWHFKLNITIICQFRIMLCPGLNCNRYDSNSV